MDRLGNVFNMKGWYGVECADSEANDKFYCAFVIFRDMRDVLPDDIDLTWSYCCKLAEMFWRSKYIRLDDENYRYEDGLKLFEQAIREFL